MSGYDYEPEKNALNRTRHGLGLDDFTGFDSEPIETLDHRQDYGEERFRAFGWIAGSPYMIVYTIRDARVRLISLRRCHEKEMRRHERA